MADTSPTLKEIEAVAKAIHECYRSVRTESRPWAKQPSESKSLYRMVALLLLNSPPRALRDAMRRLDQQ